ncbi:Cobyrinic acid A,C-diamide synthase [Candidatus Terasakiella magnetica]|uniref:Cobyrinate a,c-diamide synthase n=1 Tax=Candidatus Terasakiella magnetica TaxID=1867952 RepID=A0A1C3RM65_9PROT|nr:cobyrinate a,c-diamide synthase [Candidatus Terasakiella magnetica]SCA58209.1 Cobyrinic acid A,C-diamide synthase [Candidatus Terasakiella magnetica]
MSTAGLIIAAPNSNSGKTFITLGSLRALQRKGISVSSAKVGPDYIDPAFHGAATKRLCPNLDGWAMRDETLFHTLNALSDSSELVVCEGVMGLFDGATLPANAPSTKDGSPADIARRTGWPVVLVIDANAQAASAAALIHGFATFDKDVHVKGVIFNKVGGPGHIQLLKNACETHIPHIEILGFVPRQNDLALPERHLGLVLAEEHPELEEFLNTSADFLEEHIDLEKLVQLAQANPFIQTTENNAFFPPIGQRISIAKDKAFAFAYPALLRHWQECGAELSFFSPLRNESPTESCDAIYLPGGYPELHCDQLAQNHTFLNALRAHYEKNTTIFGECGGYMTLGRAITDKEGKKHEMAGVLNLETSFAKRKLHLGYRDVTCLVDTPFAKKGQKLRGHEFHYATIIEEKGPSLFESHNASNMQLGRVGINSGSCFASFIHLIDKTAI